MKKIILFLAIAIAFTACKNDSNSPTATVNALFAAMKNGNIDEMKKYITKNDVTLLNAGEQFLTALNTDAVKKMKDKMIEQFKEKSKNVKFNVKSEKINGDTATVQVEILDSAKTDNQSLTLVKEDNAWKVSFIISKLGGNFGAGNDNFDSDFKHLNIDSLSGKLKNEFKNINGGENFDSLTSKLQVGLDSLKNHKEDLKKLHDIIENLKQH